MNAIRWTFRDRRTGLQATVSHPVNKEQRDQLALILHNVADR